MRKELAVSSVVTGAVLAMMAGTEATAQRAFVLQPMSTSIHGTVDMTAARNGQFASLTCDALEVSATSVAMTTCPSGGGSCVPQPKWSHSDLHLTATSNPAICKYSILVPGGRAFGLSVTARQTMCYGGGGFLEVLLKKTPSTGRQTVAYGASKEADLAISQFAELCD
jgi:hypothetical protein